MQAISIGSFEGWGIYPLAALTVRLNDTVRMTMRIYNNTGSAVTRTLLAAYGRHDVGTGVFTHVFFCALRGVRIGVGATSHSVDCRTTVRGTGFDALAGIIIHDPPPIRLEHAIVKMNQLTVS